MAIVSVALGNETKSLNNYYLATKFRWLGILIVYHLCSSDL